jgi:SAM-dependent methyltransferase
LARSAAREAFDIFFLGPREARALVGVPDLWKVEVLMWIYYLPRFLPLDIWLQGRPLADRPFGDFRFGETPYFTALEILREADLRPGETFMDLGCGRGKMVFTAALAFQAQAIGVELLPTYVRFAQKIRHRLSLERETEFWMEDFTLVEVFQADVVYVAGSIFENDTRRELLAMVEQLQPDSRWISVGWQCDHPLLELQSARERLFSWGYERVYRYKVLAVQATDQAHPPIGEELQLSGAPADSIADQAESPQAEVEVILEDKPGDPAFDLAGTKDAPVVGGAAQAHTPPQEQSQGTAPAPTLQEQNQTGPECALGDDKGEMPGRS